MLNAWLMTLAGPLLNVVLGRAAEPRVQLAAFWIAFGILLVCQSACLVLQQVTAAARIRRLPFAPLALLGLLLASAAALAVLAIACTRAGDLVFHVAIPTPPHTELLARATLLRLSPVPLLVALRGLANGVAVAGRRTEWLAVATLVRVLVLGGVAAAVLGLGLGAGALAAAWALSAATAAEALFAGTVVLVWHRRDARAAAWTGTAGALLPVARLALPLAAASLVWTATRPLLAAVLGRLANPDRAQAAFGIVFPLLLLTCAPLWAFLEGAIVLPRTSADLRSIAGFALVTTLVFSAGVATLVLTPLRARLLPAAVLLTPELSRAVLPALGLLVAEPLLLTARALAQGLLVRAGRASLVLALSSVKLALMLGAGLLVARQDQHANGAVLAVGLFLGGEALDAALLTGAAARSWRVLPVVSARGPDLPLSGAGSMAA